MTEEARKSTENGDDKRASVGGKSKMKYCDNILPMVSLKYQLNKLLNKSFLQARIRKIMKMDPNITDGINAEANYVVCAATEMFVRWLSKSVYELDTKALSYKELAKFVQDHEKLDFLHQIIPHKITVREYKKILAEIVEKEKNPESGSDLSSSEEEDDDEEEEAEEEEAEEEESGDEGEENSVEEISDSEDEKEKSK